MENQEYTDFGYLVVEAFTAGRGLPVSGAQITVSSGYDEVIRILETDENGRTEQISLAAPPRKNSLSPQNPDSFSSYTIDTEKAGYYPVQNTMVPLFGGEVTIQQVTLLPLPFGYDKGKEIKVVDSENKNLI